MLITAATLSLSACGYIQSLFPDKERDYQYTTEIPPLVLPQDLNTGAVAAAVAEEQSAPQGEAGNEEKQPAALETQPTAKVPDAAENAETVGAETKSGQPEPQPEASEHVAPEGQPAAGPTATDAKKDAQQQGTPVELVRFSDGERHLRIASLPSKAWHLVSKALSRNSIEVTERDQDQKLFYVQYDPDAKKAEDGSLLDEAIFLLKGFETHEKAYVLKLIPVDDKTDLAITDKDANPVSTDAAVKLLRLLGGTIQSN